MRLLLVGGGHAMLPLLVAARRLTAAGVAVTLLSDGRRLYYSGMVPEWLGGVYTTPQATIDLAAWCARTGVRFVEDAAVALDVEARVVQARSGTRLAFDLAAFDVGAVNPGVADAGAGATTRPLHRLEAVERFVAQALSAPSGSAPTGTRRLVIVGGGAAGTEVALNLSARAMARRPGALALTLVEPAPRLLPAMPARAGRHAAGLLRARGVDVRTDARAVRADAEAVVLEGGDVLPADLVLWATGSVGSPLFRAAGLDVTAEGFVRVDRGLRVPAAPRLFAAGDCAAVEGHERLPRVGVHAVKQGPVLLDNVLRAVAALRRGEDPAAARLRPFRPYPVAPLILSTGRPEGILVLGPAALIGRPFLRLKHAVDRRWMRRHVPGPLHPALLDARSAAG